MHDLLARRFVVYGAVACALFVASGCRRSTDYVQSSQPLGYPRGKWRIAPDELRDTVLWVAQITIAHDHSAQSAAKRGRWAPRLGPSQRSDAEAIKRAWEVAASLQQDPGRFEHLARRYSDDLLTRTTGGSLGGIEAARLPPAFLDALSTMKPGEVSQVVKTSFGYHVLKRGSLPADEEVSGRRIVIRYSESAAAGADAHVPNQGARNREDAWKLADQVVMMANGGAQPFEALVAKFSESADVQQGGDLGVWPLRDPASMSAEIEQLGKLAIGEVSSPLESPDGFEILQRTKVEPRERLAAAVIRLLFNPNAKAEEVVSREYVSHHMQQMATEVAAHPEKFDTIRAGICCEEVQQWTGGRGPPPVTAALKKLKIGEVARVPIEWEDTILILKRVAPSSAPTASPKKYDLPSPSKPDFEKIVRLSSGTALASETHMLAADAARELGLEPSHQKCVADALQSVSVSFQAGDAEAHVTSWRAALARLRRELGAEDFAKFDAFLDQWGTQRILSQQQE